MEIQVNKPGIYAELNLTKKQFENCLLPLWLYGEATSQEISEFLKIPILEISEQFKASAKNELIQVHPIKPSKFNPVSKKSNINYILTTKGKVIVNTVMAFINSSKEVA
ncbi:MAG: hypothetical protein KKF62_14105 [Bacteroidetes bacterium]|nr:hypothetical protein [Bacteroidota bacterium]MBU1114199.1 hypothetical protein [Bacteroidota bacterium]MBU1797009.1 hypothetical protein [Bacteroidota bacterium]